VKPGSRWPDEQGPRSGARIGAALRDVTRHSIEAVSTFAVDPRGAWDRLYDKYVYARERQHPPAPYQADADWERRLRELLGAPWPSATAAEPDGVWPSIASAFEARGIRLGPESYLHWNDGDPALIRAIWLLVRHLRPERVVETGVAHGVSSRFILEAMNRNGSGHLWSIDLPPVEAPRRDEVGFAVGEELRGRWTLVRGSSRLRLPPLLRELPGVDLFIHDSLHSRRNVLFELERVWPALKPGGAIVVDDIDASSAFHEFLAAHPGHAALIAEAEPVRPDTRRFNQKGLFGIVLKGVAPRR
jgi:hypothetical protein